MLLACLAGCRPAATGHAVPAAQAAQKAPLLTCQVVTSYPHDTRCYTQGLFWLDGVFYESGGLYGQSSLRKVDPVSGAVLKYRDVPGDIFAEGITLFGNRILMLSWREHRAFVYDKDSFLLLRTMECPTEGWGVVFDGTDFIVSDGSSTLYRRDTATFAEKSRIYVTDGGLPVSSLNELEIINGEIWANVYMTDFIVRIDPADGHVTGRIDCSGLLLPSEKRPETDVLNGIAWDAATRRIFITGKLWPKLFEIKLSE